MNEVVMGPSRAGTCFAYLPQWKLDEVDVSKWEDISILKVPDGVGLPYPKYCGELIEHISLLGYDQAMGVCYQLKALAESRGKRVVTRLVKFELEYSLKTKFQGFS